MSDAATELDRLCAAVPFHDAEPALRARVLRRLADTELHAALAADVADDRADLRMFDLPAGSVALASDDAAALAGFLGGPVAHVSLPGRVLARELAAAGQGLLVNPGRPSEMLLDAAALAWLIGVLAERPQTAEAAPLALHAPRADALAVLADPLAERLGDMTGMLAGAALAAADWPGGRAGHLLVLSGAAAADRPALAKAMAELLAFLPAVDGGVDVTFEEIPLPPGAVRFVAEAVAVEPDEPAPVVDKPPRLRW